jgi:hypothetical protein
MTETTETMETIGIAPIEAKSQYQHFIPRFVLREFAETPTTTAIAAAAGAAGEGSAGAGGAAKRRNRRRNNKKKGGNKRATGEGGSGGQSSAVDGVTNTMEEMGLGEDDGGEVGRGVAR